MTTHLGERLVESGLLNQQQLQTALDLQRDRGGFLGHVLVKKGWLTEQQLCQSLSATLDIHWANLEDVLISRDVLRLIPKSIALVSNILPIFTNQQILYLAMEDPCDTGMIRFIESRTGMQVKPMLAPLQQLRAMIGKYYWHNGITLSA